MKLWNKIRVAYVEDQTAFRASLCNFLNSKEDVEVVFNTDDGKQLFSYMKRAMPLPNICILDISMLQMDGLTILKKIRGKWPKLPCLIYSKHSNESSIVKAIDLGANGYLTKNYEFDKLLQALQDIMANGIAYTPDADEDLFRKVLTNQIEVPTLTDRERIFIQYAGTELSYSEIAAKMNIANKTVETYRSRCFKKLKVNSRVALAIEAVRLGIINI